MSDPRIAAWDAVFNTLLEVKPDLMDNVLDNNKTAMEAACEAIRELAEGAKTTPITQPRDTRESVLGEVTIQVIPYSDDGDVIIKWPDGAKLYCEYKLGTPKIYNVPNIQQVSDRFYFLEGLVNESTYREISEAAEQLIKDALKANDLDGERYRKAVRLGLIRNETDKKEVDLYLDRITFSSPEN